MRRLELIEMLETIQENIEIVQGQVNQTIEDTSYYLFFGEGSKEFYHDKEIRTKALAFWKRKFNRVTEQLIYKN
jgi:hypothetical protein